MTDTIIVSLAFICYALLHSFFAMNPVKQWYRKMFPSYFAFYRITFNILQTIIFIIMFLLIPKSATIIWQFDGWFVYVMRCVQLSAIIALVFSLRSFSISEFSGLASILRYLHGDRNPRSDEHYKLSTTGMYGISRHPLYLFSILVVLFEPKMTEFKLLLLFWMILYFYVGSYFEERRLIKIFGSRYVRYQQEVSRIIPVKWMFKKRVN